MKEELPNSTLAILMVVTIVIALGSLFLSLDQLRKLQTANPPEISGFATSGSGQVNITILNFNSIVVEDSQINFGNCTPASTVGSNASSNDTSAPGACVGGQYPDNITVSNDGNTNLNVTVKTSVLAAGLIGGTVPSFSFSSRNASEYGGCTNVSTSCSEGAGGFCNCNSQTNCTVQYDWQSFDSASVEYDACKNLTYGGTPTTRPRFYVFARVFLPADATPRVSSNATLTFTARTPSP